VTLWFFFPGFEKMATLSGLGDGQNASHQKKCHLELMFHSPKLCAYDSKVIPVSPPSANTTIDSFILG